MKAKKLLLSFLLLFLVVGLFACGSISVTLKGENTLEVGKTITLTAESSAKDVSFEWSSSNNAVATVNNGKVTGVSAGNVIISVKAVSGKKEADASITITVTAGNTGSNNKPVIRGVTDRTIEKGSQFIPLEGITAWDEEDGDLTTRIQYEGSVRTGAVGVYDVKYTVIDKDGNVTVETAKVTVVFNDKDAPLLTGTQNKAIIVGDTDFSLLDGVAATDTMDGDVTNTIVVTGTIDPWKLGEYTVEYSAKDNSQNEAKATRKITVGLGEFQFATLEDKEFAKNGNEYTFAVALEEINSQLASFALAKLTFKVNATAACEVVPTITNGAAQAKVALEAGENDITIYFRVNSAIEAGEVKLTTPGNVTFSEVKFAFGEAKDVTAPTINVPEGDTLVLPGTLTDVDALKKFVLTDVSAQDNIDGIITSKLDVDFTGIELGNCFEEKEVTIFVVDSSQNRTEVKRTVQFVKVYDTRLIDEPEFNNMPALYDPETHIGWGLNGGGGQPEIKVEDGVLVHHNTTKDNPGWDSASSPFYRTTTEYLTPFNWYLLKFDVKAAVPRKMTVRVGLETTEALGWIENFVGGSNVPFNLTTEWQTCYVLFYVHAAKSQGNMDVAKIELKIGTFTWGGEEQGNTVYFDNCQIYLLTNENAAPKLTINTDLPTTFGKGATKPDLTKYVLAHDLEDAADIAITAADITESIDMSKAGTYDVVYKVKDSEGKEATITLKIKVLEQADTTAPVIAEAAGIVKEYDQFGDVPDLTALVTATDDVDGAITITKAMITTDADIDVAGSYEVKYTVKDTSGNEAEFTLTLIVKDKEAPKVTGKDTFRTTVGTPITAEQIIAKYVVNDNVDGLISLTTDAVKDLDKVDFNTVGEYQVKLEVSDAAGNKTVFELKVLVKEAGAETLIERHDFLLDTLNGENATAEVADGVLTINPTDIGTWASYSKIKMTGFELDQNSVYELHVKGHVDETRKIQFNIGIGLWADPWMDKFTLAEENSNILLMTPEDEDFVIRFTVDKANRDGGPTIEFCFGAVGSDGDKAGNKIYISELKLFEVDKESGGGEDPEFPNVVLDDFESYADTAALAVNWKKRYDSTNYDTGFELFTQDGNKSVKFEFAADKKYLLRYVGESFPELTDEYKYIRFNAVFASEETDVELWCYWNGGQMGYQFKPADIKCSKDGFYYVPISKWGKKASDVNGFAIGFNYKAGDVAYFDNIQFTVSKPDTEAPVITVSDTVKDYVNAGLKFSAGTNLTQAFTLLRTGITAKDNVDGDIAITDDMINLGGLNITNPYAGKYVITFNVSDEAGNSSKYEVPLTIEGADGLVTDLGHRDLVGENATVEKNDDVIEINPTNIGTWASYAKIKLTNLGLEEGKTYELRVTAKADEARKIQFNIGIGLWTDPWMDKFALSVEGSNIITLTNEFVEYAVKFKYDKENRDGGPTIEFCVGAVGSEGDKVGNKVYVSSLGLYEVESDTDETAPVITISNEVLAALAAKQFKDGDDESATFAQFLAAISATDNVDGAITVTEEMVDLDGLNPADMVAGDYTITITVSDAAGNVGTKEVAIHVAKYAKENLLADLPQIDADYTSTKWTREKYTETGWVAGGDLRSRGKDGIRVMNMSNGYGIPFRWTYNKDGAALGLADKLTFKIGNYYDGADVIAIKVIVIDFAGVSHYLIGSASEFVDFAVTTGLEDKELTFDEIDVKSVVFVTKSSKNGNAFLYVGNINLTNTNYVAPKDRVAPVITVSSEVEAALATKEFMQGADESATFAALLAGLSATDDVDGAIAITQEMVNLGGLTVDNLVAGDYTITVTVKDAANNEATKQIKIHVKKLANENLLADLPQTDADYTSTKWTREKYGDSGWVAGGDLRSRSKDGVRVMNMSNGYNMTMRYTYNKAGEILGVANKLSFKAGNYWSNAEAMSVKVIIVDAAGESHYLLGSASEFATFPVTAGLVDQSFDFDDIEVVSVAIVTKSAVNGNTFLYVGNLMLTYVERDKTAPVITISQEVLAALAAKEFVAGADESATFAAFMAGISATDDVDGAITVTQEMVDLGGLNPANLAKGDYTITITVKDSSNNEAKQEVKIHVKGDANLTLDFMDGTVGQGYASTDWTREKYDNGWQTITGQMNCREKDGVRVVNFTSGYGYSYMYTYNKAGSAIGVANKLTFKVGNYYDPKQPIPVKVYLTDVAGNKIYLVGSADEFYSLAVTEGLVDQSFTFDAAEIVSITIVCKYAGSGNAYVYVGDMHLTKVTE